MTCTFCNHGNAHKFGTYGKHKVQRWRCTSCKATFAESLPKMGTHYTSLETTTRVLALIMEGTSVRAISRLTGLHIATILSLMVTAGEKCQRLLDAKIRIVRPQLVQADELHSFVGCHEKRLRFDAPIEWGSVWTWLALNS